MRRQSSREEHIPARTAAVSMGVEVGYPDLMPASYTDLVIAARRQIREISVDGLAALGNERVTLVDVREGAEWDQGKIPGSFHIPRGVLEGVIHQLAGPAGRPSDRMIVLYCASGARSALAANTLETMGYVGACSLAGGFQAWKAAGGAWDLPGGLSRTQRGRYDRHIRLPEVGEPGQQELLDARVLIVGAGGLGSPAALYLAAAGVGTLGIADHDRVDLTNLQRQILHNVRSVGQKKVLSARDTIRALNPDVSVEAHDVRLEASGVLRLLDGYDLVVDGTDNFPTRYLINDASVHLGIPVVHGSVFRFEGQVSLFDPASGPCYRCLFPEPPAPDLAPNCDEAGVLGVLPGVIGTLQATEALKWLLGIGDSLVGRILLYDALSQQFRTLTFGKAPGCPACGDPQRPPHLMDYDQTCAAGSR